MPKKIKIDRKKLKQPDEFLSTSSRMVDYVKLNWKKTLLIIVLIFGGLGLYTGLKFYSEFREKKTLKEIGRALESFYEGKDSDVYAVDALKKAAKWNSNKSIGMISQLYLANHFYRKAIYEQALEHYKKLLSFPKINDEPFLKELAIMGMGYSSEQLGKCDEAIVKFTEAAEIPDALFPDYSLASAARCYEQKGDNNSAIQIYKSIESNYPGSSLLPEIKARMDSISSPTQPKK